MAESHIQSQAQPKTDPIAAESGSDSLSHLFKMSTTAGVGSQDYVEINKFAITCLVAGTASAFSLLSDMLLVIPIAGVLFGILAFRQIAQSAGTQTGRGVTAFGMILCLGFSIGLGTKVIMDKAASREAGLEMVQITQQFSDAVLKRNVDAAYSLFSPNFQQRVSKDQFSQRLLAIPGASPWGALKSVHTNGQYHVDESGTLAYTQVVFEFERNTLHPVGQFTLVGGSWMLEDISGVFAIPSKESGQ